MRPGRLLALFALLSFGVPYASSQLVNAADDAPSVALSRLRFDVNFLADDLREGRGVGTKGIDAAADHIASVFREAGLKPAPGANGYFQDFSIRGELRLDDATTLSLDAKGAELKPALREGFIPLAIGSSATFEKLPIVFAGYGITAKDADKKLDYDDYAGIDAKDKVVLIVRKEPQQNKEDSPFDGKQNSTFATFGHKAANAASHGVKAVLFVNDGPTVAEGQDALLDFQSAGGAAGQIPIVMIKRELAEKLLHAAGQPTLEELEAKIDADLKPQSRELDGCTATANIKVERTPIACKNVIGVLEGSGPRAEETVVIGAHYDHLGYGGMGSFVPGRSIHNGADDNASGTATVLEMARRLARRPDPLPRRVVFMLYSGEERGLLGSAHYVAHPLYPLDKTVAMINFDMVGRLKDEKLTVFGAGTSPGFESLVSSLCESQAITAKFIQGTQGEFFASDHASFYVKNIPVVFFFTGTHPDYHRPSDDSDKINYDGMARIADMGELLILDIARRPERPKFVKLQNKPAPTTADAQPTASRGVGTAYLGSRPSYTDTPDGGGVKLDGVTEGSPADKAGLKEGDVIVKFGGKAVSDLETYMGAMNAHKPGETVDVVIKRDGKETTLKVTLGTRPSRNPTQ